MFRFLALVAACSLLSLGSVASANAPTFPQSLPLDAGPEGVVIDNVGNLYATVGLADRVEVRKFSPTGAQELFATLPGTSAAGMAISPNGRTVYAAVGFVGVFAINQAGDATLVPGTDEIVLPNSLAFDKHGNLYITETFSFDVGDGLEYYENCTDFGTDGYFGRGGIWVVPKDGRAQLLLRDDLLTGVCAPNPIPYPIGANGIAYDHGELVVVNTELALLLEIPVLDVTTLGSPQVVATVTEVGRFGPWLLDGVALDVHGDAFAAAISGQAIVRIDRDDGDYTVLESDLLDFPASLAFGTGKGERQSLFVTNLSLGGPGLAGPGIAKLPVATPGMPLP